MLIRLTSAHPQMANLPAMALREKFNPRNFKPMPAVKFFARRISTKFSRFWMDTNYWRNL